jgi:hypothetical protein
VGRVADGAIIYLNTEKIMKSHWILIVATGLLGMNSAMTAQSASGQTTPVTSMANPQQSSPPELGRMRAQLRTFIDTKHAKVGEQVNAVLLVDVKVNNSVVLSQGTKLIGHITAVEADSKGHPGSMLAIVFEKAVGNGRETALHATIQALAAPLQQNITSGMGADIGVPTALGSQTSQSNSPSAATPLGGGSTPSTSHGGRGRGSVGVGDLVQLSGGSLNSASNGVFGIPGVSLAAPADNPQATVIISARNIQLERGTLMILLSRQPAN